MTRFLKALGAVVLVCVLTITTQIGGIVFLISILAFIVIDKRVGTRYALAAKVLAFTALYLFSVFVIVPPIAKLFGRVAMPLTTTNHVRPTNMLTVILNRNYVRPELRRATFDVAAKLSKKYPGTTLNYLEANFPFFNGFSLAPHLSHSDGKKLDVSFFYRDAGTSEATDRVPSWLGYGVSEGPLPGEFDRPAECARQGYWQYSFMSRAIPQGNKMKYTFDPRRTKDLVNFFATDQSIGKILIEPHLKTRLGLTSVKVRLHGCIAVRHDDHIHVQLK